MMAQRQMGRFDNDLALAQAFRSAKEQLRPPPELTPSEWAERNVRIPIGNAVPGLIRFENAPYQREPLDMLIDPDCYRITLMWGAQLGKTQLALCGQAYHIAMRPMSQMMMQPTETDLKVWLNAKFDPMIEANPAIARLLPKARAREGVNNTTMKSYPGGFMMFSWSGSPQTMRGRSAPIIVADEPDGYKVTPEGHPVSLLWQRAATFGDQRRLMEMCTPTTKGASHIEAAFEAGDRRRFHVPCPDCGTHQVLRWEQVTWLGRDDEKGGQEPETARYTCIHCASLWDDGKRRAAVRAGAWRAERPFKGHASYHLNELYSTFRRLRDIVQDFLDKRASGDLQTFTNVSLALPWEETGERANADTLIGRAEAFAAPVPAGGLVLTAGVDMQQDRLEVEIVAWGHGEESWSVDYQVLWGDPLQGDVWEELEALLSGTWQHETGAHLPITATCVDTGGTGGTTQAAYEWLRGKTGRRIFGTKGVGGWGRPIVASPSRKRSGQRRRHVDLFLVGVDEAKLTVMRRLGVAAPGPGHCHFPEDRDEDWYRQLTAETLVTRYVKGFPVREWHKVRDRNEALDCRVYALAALKIASPSMKRAEERLMRDAEAVEQAREQRSRAQPTEPPPVAQPQVEKTPEVPDTAANKRPRRARPVRPRGWVNNW